MNSITRHKKAHKNSFGKCLCVFSPMYSNHLWHLNWYNVENIEGFELYVSCPPCHSACTLKGENASGAKMARKNACPVGMWPLKSVRDALLCMIFTFSFRKLGRAQLSEELPLK